MAGLRCVEVWSEAVCAQAAPVQTQCSSHSHGPLNFEACSSFWFGQEAWVPHSLRGSLSSIHGASSQSCCTAGAGGGPAGSGAAFPEADLRLGV